MTASTEMQIAETIENAEDFREDPAVEADGQKPRLLIEDCSPDRTVAALRDILASSGELYDRGVPVRVAFDRIQQAPVAQALSAEALVMLAHRICRPVVKRLDRSEANVRLRRWAAVMYLDWRGQWRLPALNGIASAPLLQDDGTVTSSEGYREPVRQYLERLKLAPA